MILKNPKVSVIIPVYNNGRYLQKCLDSVITQTYKNIEVICINDGSTDESLDILKHYSKLNTKIGKITLINQENRGTLLARKKGVTVSSGQYILFLDSDDYFSSSASLLTAVQEIDRYQVDILEFSKNIDGTSGTDIKRYQKAYKNKASEFKANNLINFIFKRRSWSLINKIFKAENIKKAFAEIENIRLSTSEDAYTSVFISYFSKSFRSIETPIITYRLGSGISTTNSLTFERYQKFIESFKIKASLEKFLKKYNCYDEHRGVVTYLDNRIRKDAFHALGRLETKELKRAFDILNEHINIKGTLQNYSLLDYLKYSFLYHVTFGSTKARYLRKSKRLRNMLYLKDLIK